MTVSVSPPLSSVFDEIRVDVLRSSKEGLSRVGQLVPVLLKRNFLAAGERGGEERWPDVTEVGMSMRKVNLDRPDQPLIDTGYLMKSGVTSALNGGMVIETSLADYGYDHEYGLGNFPRRSHMWILDEDLAEIDKVFEEGFNSE